MPELPTVYFFSSCGLRPSELLMGNRLCGAVSLKRTAMILTLKSGEIQARSQNFWINRMLENGYILQRLFYSGAENISKDSFYKKIIKL